MLSVVEADQHMTNADDNCDGRGVNSSIARNGDDLNDSEDDDKSEVSLLCQVSSIMHTLVLMLPQCSCQVLLITMHNIVYLLIYIMSTTC